MTAFRSVGFDRSGGYARGLRPMTPREISTGMRKRRYSWGKTAVEMALESGVSIDTVNAAVAGERLSDAAVAKLVVYLRQPIIKVNRDRVAKKRGARGRVMSLIAGVAALGNQYGVIAKSSSRRQEMKTPELLAYFWLLDERVKEAIRARYPGVNQKFLLPDHLPAWAWVERLEQLTKHEANPAAHP